MIHVLSSFIYYTDNISLLILAGKSPFVRAYTFLSSCVFMIMVSISRRSLMEQPSDYKSYCFALYVNVFQACYVYHTVYLVLLYTVMLTMIKNLPLKLLWKLHENRNE